MATSTRLADIRRKGMKIYTLALEVVFSAITTPERRPLHLATVVTLTAGSGAKAYRLTNPDLTAEMDGDLLRMVLELEDPSALIGHDISTLAEVDAMQLNVAALFQLAGVQLGEGSQMSWTLRLNGVPVIVSTTTGAALAQSEAVSIPVGTFSRLWSVAMPRRSGSVRGTGGDEREGRERKAYLRAQRSSRDPRPAPEALRPDPRPAARARDPRDLHGHRLGDYLADLTTSPTAPAVSTPTGTINTYSFADKLHFVDAALLRNAQASPHGRAR